MAGLEIYKNAVEAMEEAGIAALKQTDLPGDDIALLIPYQANIRIIDRWPKSRRYRWSECL